MTLHDQIIKIHSQHFSKEFHEYRHNIVPAMINDLAEMFFELLQRGFSDAIYPRQEIWYLVDSADLRAVMKARELLKTCGLRQDTPGVEV